MKQKNVISYVAIVMQFELIIGEINMGSGGYTEKNQPNDKYKLPIDGIAASGGDPSCLEGNALPAPAEGPPNDGDNPSMPTSVPFGNKSK
jgi:hypothetical protein